MYTVTILHGSSCVGKSTLMNSQGDEMFKIEMDACDNWERNQEEWPAVCLPYLSQRLAENTEQKDVVATCGGLPLPTHPGYTAIADEHNVRFVHTLVLVPCTADYVRQIIERQRAGKMQELLEHYQWRERGRHLYDGVVVNARHEGLEGHGTGSGTGSGDGEGDGKT